LILHNNSDDDGGHGYSNCLEELGAEQTNISKLAIVKNLSEIRREARVSHWKRSRK
jgi:hypothetical protein